MGPGESQSSQPLSLSVLSAWADKLRCRKNGRCWVHAICACAEEGGGTEKGVYKAHGMLLFCW